MTVTTRRLIQLVTGAAFLGASVAAVEPPPSEQIAAWVAGLASAQYSQREAASRGLIEAGPAAIEPLREAIGSGDLEVITRAIEITRVILGGEDAAATAAAEAFLQSLAESDDPSVAHMAASTLDFHAIGQAEAARAELEALGAEFKRGLFPDGQVGQHVKLDARWRGATPDLRLLVRVPGPLIVSLHGVKIEDAAVPILARLRHTPRIELYGTGATAAQVAALQEKLPETAVDVRKGGKLGVGGQPNPGPCLITQVQEDSAAARAGVQVGDIVVSVNDQAVENFEALTDLVGGRGPGEKVVLEIQRGLPGEAAQRLRITAELDAW